ncbi:hypothetical protein [Streptomyces sp. NPDC001820]
MADQFKDKADAHEERAPAEGGAKKEASQRSSAAKGKPTEEPRERSTEEAMQDAEDKFRQDYDI